MNFHNIRDISNNTCHMENSSNGAAKSLKKLPRNLEAIIIFVSYVFVLLSVIQGRALHWSMATFHVASLSAAVLVHNHASK